MNDLGHHSGRALAIAAAALLGACSADGEIKSASAQKVECIGVNSCRGQSECQTATSACKGKNDCRGLGFLELTEAQCKEKGGTIGG
ncbi:MAG: hypothetical protein AAF434_19570 [Pseudomonadota bacterium]